MKDKVATEETEIQEAGFVSRTCAFLIDIFIVTVSYLIFFALWESINSLLSDKTFLATSPNTLVVTASLSLYYVLYNSLFWAFTKQTPGMAVLGVGVTGSDGEKLGFTMCLVRVIIGYTVSVVTLFFGFIWVLFDEKRRGFHDYIAGSKVIYMPGALKRFGELINRTGFGAR